MEKNTLEQLEQKFRLYARHEYYDWQHMLVQECLHYWELYDGARGTMHSRIIQELYLQNNAKVRDVANSLNLVRRTVYRYRVDYMNIFVEVGRRNNVVF